MGDSAELRKLVAALAVKVQKCREDLDAQAVGNALYGLRRMSDSQEVRQLLTALTVKVQQSREELSVQAVAMSLYGLQCMGNSQELLQLLKALAINVEQCRTLEGSQGEALLTFRATVPLARMTPYSLSNLDTPCTDFRNPRYRRTISKSREPRVLTPLITRVNSFFGLFEIAHMDSD